MSLLVTGSIGIDTLTTPHGQANDVLGGSAVHFAFAATFFTPVRLVGVVGADFPDEFRRILQEREIDLAGLEARTGSKTFRWSGKYVGDMNDAQTLSVDLNVLAEQGPKLPASFADSPCVFLAATHPDLQRDFIGRLKSPRLIVADTRDLWINTTRDSLDAMLGQVHGAILNDGEARLLTGEISLIRAGRRILEYGPQFVIIKKGEHGVMLVTADRVAALPGFPTADVIDPTGAGDSFAGGMMGYLASQPEADFDTLGRALARGTITASYTIEGFGLTRIRAVSAADVERRLRAYAAMLAVA
jgi:sugar/nucleoside kinase (ribokinase family)